MRGFMKTLGAMIAASLCLTGTVRADECHLSWDVPCCRVPGSDLGMADVVLTICNCTNTRSDYEWFFPNDPFNAMPFQGTTTLDPGECVEIPITIFCPPGQPGEATVFTIVITNLTTGTVTKCQGSFVYTGEVKAEPADPVIVVETPRPVDFAVTATNTSNKPVSWAPQTRVVPADIWQVEPIEPIVLGPGETQTLNLTARRVADHEPFVFYDIILLWDQDGDGDNEAGSSVALRIDRGACIADLDGNGRVNSGDLAILLAAWGPCF